MYKFQFIINSKTLTISVHTCRSFTTKFCEKFSLSRNSQKIVLNIFSVFLCSAENSSTCHNTIRTQHVDQTHNENNFNELSFLLSHGSTCTSVSTSIILFLRDTNNSWPWVTDLRVTGTSFYWATSCIVFVSPDFEMQQVTKTQFNHISATLEVMVGK